MLNRPPQRMHFAGCFNDVMADLLGFFPLPDAFTSQSIAPHAITALIYIKRLDVVIWRETSRFCRRPARSPNYLGPCLRNLGLPRLLVLSVCDFARGSVQPRGLRLEPKAKSKRFCKFGQSEFRRNEISRRAQTMVLRGLRNSIRGNTTFAFM